MSKLYLFVFLSVFLIISNSLSLFKTEKSLSASGAKNLCKKPKMIYPVNETLAEKNFFLGTGVEFRFRARGKYPDINLVFPERWCFNVSKPSKPSILINNENGLHLEKVSISSGGAGPVILVDETYGSNSIWTFEKISGNIYNILYSGWLRDIPINTYALTAFMDEQQKTWVSIAPFDPNNVNQKWRVAN